MRISDWSSDVCSSDLVVRLHADRLRLRLHLDRGIKRDVPFAVKLGLGHAVSEGRPGGEVARGTEGGLRQLFRRYDAVMETTALALVGRHDADGEKQFRSAALHEQHRTKARQKSRM